MYLRMKCILCLSDKLPQLTELMIDYGTDSKCAPERAAFLSGRDAIWIQLEETVFSTPGSYYAHSWFLKSYIFLRRLMYVIIHSHLYKFDSVLVQMHCFSPHLFSAGTNAHHTSAVSSCTCLFKRFGSECARFLHRNSPICSDLYPTHWHVC